MKREEREQISRIIKKSISETGICLLSVLRSVLDKECDAFAGILGNSKFKPWIMAEFPEFNVIGVNDNVLVTQKDPTDDPVLNKLINVAIHDGKVAVASIPTSIGIDWKPLANGKKLYEWLKETYSKTFDLTEDYNSLYFKGHLPAGQNPAGLTPAPAPVQSSADNTTRSYVYGFCWFPMTGTTVRTLRELTGNTINDTKWVSQRVSALSRSLIGLNGGLLDDSSGNPSRMAFRLGLKTDLNQDIYVILVPNYREGLSPWMFSGVAYPGQNTDEGLWLCEKFGIKPQIVFDTDRLKAIESIGSKIDSLQELQHSLLASQKQLSDLLEAGSILPADIGDQITEYIQGWKTVKSELDALGESYSEDSLDIFSVQKLLDEWNDTNKVQENLREKFKQLVMSAWSFMEDNMLCAENKSSEEIAGLNQIAHHSNTGEYAVQIREAFEPYRALSVLRNFDTEAQKTLGDAEYSAIDTVDEHFGSSLTIPSLRHTIFNRKVEMDFLNLIPEITALIRQIEIKNTEKTHEVIEYDDADLLDAALDGSLWNILNDVFREPDALETAVMLSDLGAVKDIIDNNGLEKLGYDSDLWERIVDQSGKTEFSEAVTPLDAATRLEEIFGNDNVLIDKCLFYGILEKQEGAAQKMVQHYVDTGRPQLAKKLLMEAEKSVSSEVRRSVIPDLIEAGCLEVSDAVDLDILSLLSPRGEEVVRRFCTDENLRENLLAINESIQPTLIHHIVYLSPELQSYIVRPENNEEIQQFLAEAPNKTISDVLRKEDFERGSSALQIARRLYSFVGNWNGLAQRIAMLYPDTWERQLFLFDIFSGQLSDPEMIQFLDDNPIVRAKNYSYYLDLLFRNGMFERIVLSSEGNAEELTAKDRLIILLANARQKTAMTELPEFDLNEACRYPDLVLSIAFSLAESNRELFEKYLAKVFPYVLTVYEKEAIDNLVTAQGTLTEEEIHEIADHSVESCPELAIYCGELLNITDYDEIKKTCLQKKYESLGTLTGDEHNNVVRLIQKLDPENYSELAQTIFETQLKNYLEQDIDPVNKAEEISSLFNKVNLSEQSLTDVIEVIVNNPVFCQSPLYETLLSQINTTDQLKLFLEKAYQRWLDIDDRFRTETCFKLIEKYQQLPDDLLVQYEDALLKHYSTLPTESFQKLILYIEEIKGREVYLNYIHHIFDRTSDLSEDSQEISEAADAEELSYICDALEDDTVNIEEFLEYCNTLNVTKKNTAADSSEHQISDSQNVIQALFAEPKDAHSWLAFERLIPQERIKARAKALYYYAEFLSADKSEDVWKVEKVNGEWDGGLVNKAWERCVNYCMAEDQNELFYHALRSWLNNINAHYEQNLPWYSAKFFMRTLQSLLEASDSVLSDDYAQSSEFPACPEETAAALVNEAIDVFKRIDKIKSNQISGDDNHNSLRIILELSLRLGCEGLLLERLGDELTGAYINLGIVVICRLLLTGKISVAMPFLKSLTTSSYREYKYARLLDKLAAMETEQEVRDWLADESNRATLRFILPNGNIPDILRLQTLVMGCYISDPAIRENNIKVIENILDCYPRDVMCYKSLFIMCKEDYHPNLRRIYRALVGIYKNYPINGRAQFTRDRFQVLKLIVILRHVMENLGDTDIEFETITDLVRSYSYSNENSDEIVSRLNQLSSEIKTLFIGLSKESDEFSLLISSLLGAVTENWRPFFYEAFRQRRENWNLVYCVDRYGWRGLLRGALYAWQSLPEEERDLYAEWINNELKRETERSKESRFVKSIRFFSTITNQANLSSVNWDILRLPWEEHFVCFGNLKDMSDPAKNNCYKIMMNERLKGQSAKMSFIVMLRLAQDAMKGQMLHRNAREWFDRGDYDLSAAAYDALCTTRVLPNYDDPSKKDYYLESFETWMRIAYVFAGIDITAKNCTPHSSMNMMTVLLNSKYAKYFDRLRMFFKGTNLKLFLMVRKVLSSSMKDTEITQLIGELNGHGERLARIAFIHFILSKNKAGEYLFLSDKATSEFLGRKLEIEESRAKAKKYWLLLQTKPAASLFPPIDEGTEYISEGVPGVLVLDFDASNIVQKYCSEAERYCESYEDIDIQTIIDEYNELSTYTDSDFSKRLQLSAQMCHYDQNNENSGNLEKSLVRFGINYYFYQRNRINKDDNPEAARRRANSVMLDLALYGLKTPAVSSEIIQYLPNWLQYTVRGYSSIDSLLADYSENKIGYAAITRLLSDTEYFGMVNSLMDILNSLLSAANRIGSNRIDMQSYISAQIRLNEIVPTREWVEMYAALNEMIRQAMNRLDQRPSLKITIFNNDQGLQFDGLYGEIENTGRDIAGRLELQATFPNNISQSISSLYSLQSLHPNEKATFAIQYSSDKNEMDLEYVLNLSYSYKEERINCEPVSGRLVITPYVKAYENIPQLNTYSAAKFIVDDSGTIVGKDFKGRKTEINSLISLMNGDNFSDYQSAIVQGIKRSGKTSLLNYIMTYINAYKHENSIAIWCDCQGLTGQYVYKVFFKTILDELPLKDPEILNHPNWPGFVNQWRLKEGETDRDPADMSLFYRQLHAMLEGKGIYLIVDEFDALLARLNDDMGYNSLLQSLRSLQMNQDCQAAVHMILCGANTLLTYRQTGSFTNQMFQSYQTIRVGQMLAADIQELIIDWLQQYPFIRLAGSGDGTVSPTIQWIEFYTGGLVWYTKLLMNEAVKMVLSDNRNCIYPSDICNAFNSICIFANCRQLTDGCDEKDLMVIDAMQYLSNHRQSYVSFEQLMRILDGKINSEQLKKSLDLLTDSLELLELKAPGTNSYRFRIELYRRYFRTQPSRFVHDESGKKTVSEDSFQIAQNMPNLETADSNSMFII